MNKVYQRIVWENYPSENTPINETNLNRMDYAVDEIDSRVVTFDTTKANQSDLLQSLKNITYNDNTGIFTFTWWNGSTKEVDLNVEKIPVSFSMSPQGILTMTTADGTVFTADIASLIKLYTFNNTTDIRFNTVTDANGNKTITAFIVDGSVTERKLQPNFLADCREAVSDAETAQTAAETAQGNAEDFAEDAEAWARGTRNGTDVTSTDETYHNNSKFYAEKSASDGEAWAKGTRGGVDVPSTDETYHNSAKYWAQQASLQKTTFTATCTGQAENQNKIVTVPSEQNFVLKTGVIIGVKFDANNTYSATTAAPVTLNVNNTGAKQIYGANTATQTGTNTTFFGRANYINYYMYDGTYWVWAGSSADNNTTYTPQALGTGYGTCATAEATVAKEVTLSGYALVKNGIVSVKFTNAVPANATMNINSKGAKNIFYKGVRITSGIIKSGDLATFIYDGTQYQLISIDSGTGSGGGHTIQDESGAAVTQRATMQYTGDVEVTDDSTNEKTVVNIPKAQEITWEAWNQLTDAEKETGKWDITNVPGADGTISGELLTKVWENPSPASAFAAQNIVTDNDGTGFIIWVCKRDVSPNSQRLSFITVASGSATFVDAEVLSSGTHIRVKNKLLTYQSPGKFAVSDTYGAFEDGSYYTNNDYIIPIIAYEIKNTITLKVNAIARDVSTSASKCMLEDGTNVADRLNEVITREIPEDTISVLLDISHVTNDSYNTGRYLTDDTITIPETGNYQFYGNIRDVSAGYCYAMLTIFNDAETKYNDLCTLVAGTSAYAYPERNCAYIPVYLTKGTKVKIGIYHALPSKANVRAILLKIARHDI